MNHTQRHISFFILCIHQCRRGQRRDLDEEIASFLRLGFADPYPLLLLPFSLFYVSLVYVCPLLCHALGPFCECWARKVASVSTVVWESCPSVKHYLLSVQLDACSWGDANCVHSEWPTSAFVRVWQGHCYARFLGHKTWHHCIILHNCSQKQQKPWLHPSYAVPSLLLHKMNARGCNHKPHSSPGGAFTAIRIGVTLVCE